MSLGETGKGEGEREVADRDVVSVGWLRDFFNNINEITDRQSLLNEQLLEKLENGQFINESDIEDDQELLNGVVEFVIDRMKLFDLLSEMDPDNPMTKRDLGKIQQQIDTLREKLPNIFVEAVANYIIAESSIVDRRKRGDGSPEEVGKRFYDEMTKNRFYSDEVGEEMCALLLSGLRPRYLRISDPIKKVDPDIFIGLVDGSDEFRVKIFTRLLDIRISDEYIPDDIQVVAFSKLQKACKVLFSKSLEQVYDENAKFQSKIDNIIDGNVLGYRRDIDKMARLDSRWWTDGRLAIIRKGGGVNDFAVRVICDRDGKVTEKERKLLERLMSAEEIASMSEMIAEAKEYDLLDDFWLFTDLRRRGYRSDSIVIIAKAIDGIDDDDSFFTSTNIRIARVGNQEELVEYEKKRKESDGYDEDEDSYIIIDTPDGEVKIGFDFEENDNY